MEDVPFLIVNRELNILKMKIISRFLLLLGFVVAAFGISSAQSIVAIPAFDQNPVFSVSATSVFLSFSGEKMTLGGDLVISGGSGTYTYEWTAADKVLGSGPTLEIASPGKYILSISDACDCQKTVIFNVTGQGGVSDASSNSFRVYPIPAVDRLTVEARNGKNMMQVSVTSMDGRMVIFSPVENKSKCNVNVSELPAGMHVVHCVYEGKEVETTMFLKK